MARLSGTTVQKSTMVCSNRNELQNFKRIQTLKPEQRDHARTHTSEGGKTTHAEGSRVVACSASTSSMTRTRSPGAMRARAGAENMMHFDGEARLRRDRTMRNLGALRREGFQPARRHPSASRHRYHQRGHTDDELEQNSADLLGTVSIPRLRTENSSEQLGGVRREYSNERLGTELDASNVTRSRSAPPVRVGCVIPAPNSGADQVCVSWRQMDPIAMHAYSSKFADKIP